MTYTQTYVITYAHDVDIPSLGDVESSLCGTIQNSFGGDRIHELERQLAESEKAQEWQPIETAPKGRRILFIIDKMNTVVIGAWDDFRDIWSCSGRMITPTHWKPIGPTPKEGE